MSLRDNMLFKHRYGYTWYKDLDWGNVFLLGLIGFLIIMVGILFYILITQSINSIEINTMSCLEIYEVIVGDSNVIINAKWEQIGVYYNAMCK